MSDIVERIDFFLGELDEKNDLSPYQKFFMEMLKEWGVDSPDELSDDDKKKFFDAVDKRWRNKKERKSEDTELDEQGGKWAGTGVKHPGILEVPEGKDVDELGKEHFISLAKDKGLEPIVRALMNLYRWNKNDNPDLSKWAKDMQETVSAAIKKERKPES